MPVKNVECQLAQAQLQRYMAGDQLTKEVLSSLEQHISSCEPCRADAKAVRERIKERSKTSTVAAVHMPVAPSKAAQLMQTLNLKTASALPDPRPAEAGARRNLKPLYYSGALALLLVGMTYLNDPTKLFGGRADAAAPIAAAIPVASSDVVTPPTEAEYAEFVASAYPMAVSFGAQWFFGVDPLNVQEPVAEEVATPVVEPPPTKPALKPVAKVTRKAHPKKKAVRTPLKAKRDTGSIKVYDPRTGAAIRP